MSLKIASYVFVDLETTSLPSLENNKTKIIELGMVSVCRDHLLEARPGCSPRVQDKLTLCFSPQKIISPESTTATGLDNDLLEHKTSFNKDICNLVKTFLNVQPKPVCLIAHNGMGFDFPILKNHFERNQECLPDVMCADSYHGFYDILEPKEAEMMEIFNRRVDDGRCSPKSSGTPNNTVYAQQSERGEKVRKDLNKIFSELPTNIITEANNSTMEKTTANQVIEIPDEVSSKPEPEAFSPATLALENPCETFVTDNLDKLGVHVKQKIQLQNESTPKRPTRYTSRQKKSAKEIRERRFPWPNNNKPKKSYKLGPLYERVLSRQAQEAHQAENDCIFTLEISVALGQEFVAWVDDNCVLFEEIRPMTIGVKTGF